MISSCKTEEQKIVMHSEVAHSSELTTINFKLEGIDCNGDLAKNTASKVIEINGVSNISIYCNNGDTYVTYDVNLVNPEVISNKISNFNSKLKVIYINTIVK